METILFVDTCKYHTSLTGTRIGWEVGGEGRGVGGEGWGVGVKGGRWGVKGGR